MHIHYHLIGLAVASGGYILEPSGIASVVRGGSL